MKQVFKYLTIIALNQLILTGMLAFWTDSVELTYNDLVRPIEFLKILGISCISLIGIRILIGLLRKKNIHSIRKRVKYASILTLVISTYLYVDYSINIINNQFVDITLRKNIMDKVEPTNILANGTKADNLTIEEYDLIIKTNNWYPRISDNAYNIGYSYTYDGFLPDYSFTLTYDLPLNSDIEEINYKKGGFTKFQTIERLTDRIRVNYYEGKQ